ncbi:gamma-glutamyl-gamma-aminobutyrate hydrolase family protein [Kordiimonas sp. SCSIO 12610]|uniref:gamma-glutamyl-gamma-aminobutyrate hydrolase family protein n=1 Tax=Kordiimonas sp. SCSIO 12610 TaxID=2829597 RepID=UPI00210BDB7B|nr:gamma-glutamyl-gamma-aminobutyrate hydrolase family protein [Kordiimonas sp. SCSIO 12610]UTW54216.1 gamma-glutamyl-gamma-aminobutyrate hydrolase family protein [Kordiimonas sp. SCSIO 12610]
MKPVIGVICDTKMIGLHRYHQVGHKYIKALQKTGKCTPLLIPSSKKPLEHEDLFSIFDGFLIPGSYSNIERHHYGEPPAPIGENQDPLRDATSLSLIRAIIKKKAPFLAICRGFQELNVAMGGTLHPRLHEIDGRFDHRENLHDPIEKQYGLSHSVSLASDGLLCKLTAQSEIMVNSLHGQGVKDIAPGLKVEAIADDDTVEALSVYDTHEDSHDFGLGVQWHPEWRVNAHGPYKQIFNGFLKAAKRYRKNRT